jgi:thioredoxin-related protein
MKFEDLSKEEQQLWENRASSLSKSQKAFIVLTEMKKCIWCNTKFKEGLIKKRPKEYRTFNALDWFTPKYLFHVQTTHGYEPDDITHFIEQL